ncbi:MAG: iron(III) transport system ATP-binding protein [Candidatus Hydrogenedentes bacterium]|nr:iron(III) transport system ATP-binding protein [Candidatus Hydrogenedentota bacterium]
MPSVEFREVTKRFGAIVALDALSFSVDSGQALCLFGPSGCGKTTALRLLAGLESPDSGEIHVDGEWIDAPGRPMIPIPGAIGMVFQDLALWPHMRAARHIDFVLRGTGLDRAERNARVRQTLEQCRLSDCARAYPAELSGGQRQRLAIARALAPDPPLLLLDEPFASLDGDLRAHFLALFNEHKRDGATVVFTTHRRDEADALADVLLLMDGHARDADG